MKIPRQQTPKLFIPMASMGDIAFLLIIFFILTSKFIKEDRLELREPESQDIEKMTEDVQVSVAIDRHGAVYVQGDSTTVEALQGLVAQLVEGRESKIVTLKVDKGVRHEFYGGVIDALSKAGVTITLVGSHTEE
jgi:biopolymer transport protein ExbD